MMSIAQPASVAITKLIIDALPILIPILFLALGGLLLQLRTVAKAVDGQMTDYKELLKKTSEFEKKIASLEASKTGFELGQAKAEGVAVKQAGEVAAARALPPDNPAHPPVAHQLDRVESTVVETGVDVKDVKAKLEEKRDK